MEEIIIESKVGKIKGIKEEGACTFRYVPYAKTERFKDPAPYLFEDVYDATVRGFDCYQDEAFYKTSGFYAKEFPYDKTKKYNEEFMTMTIITPDVKGKYPVMAFIHGGGFTTGCVEDLPYGDTKEYAKRGVILVSIGYRLNVFAQYDGLNLGLKDQIFALKWIKDNIEAFGGDKDQIIMAGQSAGAMSICDLCYSGELKDVVKGAIIMSGTGAIPKIMKPYTKEEQKFIWDEVRNELKEKNLNAETCNAKELYDAYKKVTSNPKYYRIILPCVDGKLIPDYPHVLSKENKVLNIPLLLGITAQDMFSVIMYNMTLNWGLKHSKSAYAYFFEKPLPGDIYKSFHACDLWYAFNNMERCWRPFGKNDYEISNKMMDYFANFVKTLNPNGENLPLWKPLGRKQKGFLKIDGKFDGSYTYPFRCRNIQLHYFLFEKKIGNAKIEEN